MKPILFLILTLFITSFQVQKALAQNKSITRDNYYNYLNKSNQRPLTTNWLQTNEIIPVILEELNKYGFEENYDNVLFRLPTNEHIVLDVYSRKANIGFLYNAVHHADPQIEHRKLRHYRSIQYDYSGDWKGIKFDSLQQNLTVLQENWYWYQYSEDKNEINDFVCRAKIIEILRADIRESLAKHKNLKTELKETAEKKVWVEVAPNIKPDSELLFVDNWAQFLNGQEGINQFIKENVKYPAQAYKDKTEGVIILEYEVTKKGEIGEIAVVAGGDKLLENEAVRVIKNMPAWKPANQKGKPISVKYSQRFSFKLPKGTSATK